MTTIGNMASLVTIILAVMMTVVSWRVLKGNPVLDSPVIHVAVGVLTFIGLRYRPGGLIGQILLGYEAVAISILFLLLYRGFKRMRQSSLAEGLRRLLENHFHHSRGSDAFSMDDDNRGQCQGKEHSREDKSIQ